MTNFLQSDAWARFQSDLGHEVLRGAGEGYSYLATVEGGRAGRYLYCPYGPEADSPEALARALAELKELARAHRCLFVRVEPSDPRSFAEGTDPEADLRARGLRFSPRQIQPSHTWMVDLTQDEDALLKGMNATNRNLHRNIHKKGVSFRASRDPEEIGILLRYLNQTAERVGFNRQKDDYLTQAARSLMPQGDAALYVAELHGEPIGAAFVYDSADTRTYAHASMDYAHRRLSANNPLVTRMMLDAKEAGLRRFDMFGIAPEGQPDHEWAGFTKFKKSYGGYPVTYPGTWDLPVSTAAYAAFRSVYAAKEAAKEKGLPAARRLAGTAEQKVRGLVGRLRR
ncbi:lipid II:glycine glycyltransferase (peptidoglycan interpeptide bridge formation enzyme) [Kocuria sp. AG109]|uniref:Methicillin resistance protein n=1 Tax=Rothia kristinae TaxID=37923 RepID=A0A199NV07_9MICC|nr:peptidoglycan bridge formation glycyltransferase FemA/FemB family protein [Rothia kristinae]TDP56098.1 lipid II:glycine glycyltransferase (peptidoglycan interpeptide bridge formation enzyme) [Kocuria sp. AG109]SIL93304.1 Lipid II:glycine glycyltransferase [Mycobacteroides abscessus subsp. abscessus]MBG7587278.1 peptidoglycan bridge formation glycyltransferase FemA/FemB family protein [Rothia kristinae]MCA1170375.1 peptidoglycan bridge formation glycyltransferase FemA/FemB family protein [Rot